MAIEYGMGNLSTDEKVRGSWVQLYQQLSDQEKEYFHSALPPLLMAAGITHISEATIPHILARLDLLDVGRDTTNRGDLETLHILAVHGKEAAEKYARARVAAVEMLRANLPPGFEPDAAHLLRRFIGMTTNIATESSSEFLSSLTRKWFNPFPKLTKAESMKEDKDFRSFSKAIATGEAPHPVLKGEVAVS
ncbi:MAG: hypothetical protein WC869_01035 [Phycisphaerae bacterium]|jgi:hypothetical protein